MNGYCPRKDPKQKPFQAPGLAEYTDDATQAKCQQTQIYKKIGLEAPQNTASDDYAQPQLYAIIIVVHFGTSYKELQSTNTQPVV